MAKRIALLLLAALLLLGGALAEGTQEINTQLTHYLLLGQDGYADSVVEDARTDTIVIVTLDEKYNRVIMTSLLRDSKIENLKGNLTKANVLYKNYGFDGTITCIERALDIEISGAVLVNFEHVKPVIDALGGVDIEIDENERIAICNILLNADPNLPAKTGLVHMTGRIALAYMRIRSAGQGDFSRTQRQRKVVGQLFDKCRDLSLMELVGVYNQVSGGMKMSFSALEILAAMRAGYSLIANDADFVEFSVPQKGTFSYSSLDHAGSALSINWRRNRTKFHELLNNP